jgi:hypothetical protein
MHRANPRALRLSKVHEDRALGLLFGWTAAKLLETRRLAIFPRIPDWTAPWTRSLSTATPASKC